jgi:hypothetical protein
MGVATAGRGRCYGRTEISETTGAQEELRFLSFLLIYTSTVLIEKDLLIYTPLTRRKNCFAVFQRRKDQTVMVSPVMPDSDPVCVTRRGG